MGVSITKKNWQHLTTQVAELHSPNSWSEGHVGDPLNGWYGYSQWGPRDCPLPRGWVERPSSSWWLSFQPNPCVKHMHPKSNFSEKSPQILGVNIKKIIESTPPSGFFWGWRQWRLENLLSIFVSHFSTCHQIWYIWDFYSLWSKCNVTFWLGGSYFLILKGVRN